MQIVHSHSRAKDPYLLPASIFVTKVRVLQSDEAIEDPSELRSYRYPATSYPQSCLGRAPLPSEWGFQERLLIQSVTSIT